MGHRKHPFWLILGTAWLLATGCTGTMNPEQYAAWIQDYDNGLRAKTQHGDYVFDVQYLPLSLRQWQAAKTSPGASILADSLLHFKLTLGFADGDSDVLRDGADGARALQQRIYYFSYQFQSHLYLEQGGAHSPCVLYHFERANDLKPTRVFTLAFPNNTPGKPIKFVIDSPYFGSVPIKLNIVKDNLPSIAL